MKGAKSLEYLLEIGVKFSDDNQFYTRKVLKSSDDLFELEAYYLQLSKAFEYLGGKKMEAETIILKRRASDHSHPDYPCELAENKKEWTCGAPL